MKTWRLLETKETNGAMQMAIDEAIMTHRIKGKVPNTLRFFTWKPKCLTIGYFQNLNKRVNVEKANDLGVDVVRRYTGGGAVLHDRELTYSLAISEKEVPQNIVESYKVICDGLMKGLDSIGVHTEFKPINDILVNKKKISGNAQTRKEGIVLQHGTILLDVDIEEMFSLLKVPDEKIKDKMINKAEERVTSLKTEMGRDLTIGELRKALIKGFEDVFEIKFEESELTTEELQLAEKLCKEKYSTKEWRNLR